MISNGAIIKSTKKTKKLTSIIALAMSIATTDVVNAQSIQKGKQQNSYTLIMMEPLPIIISLNISKSSSKDFQREQLQQDERPARILTKTQRIYSQIKYGKIRK